MQFFLNLGPEKAWIRIHMDLNTWIQISIENNGKLVPYIGISLLVFTQLVSLCVTGQEEEERGHSFH